MGEKVSAQEQSARDQAVQEAKDRAMQSKLDNAYEASRTTPYKHGGHVHHSEHYGKHAAGFQKERDKVKEHAAGHKHHDDHVVAMCGGGRMKK